MTYLPDLDCMGWCPAKLRSRIESLLCPKTRFVDSSLHIPEESGHDVLVLKSSYQLHFRIALYSKYNLQCHTCLKTIVEYIIHKENFLEIGTYQA